MLPSFQVTFDIFRSSDLSGVAEAAWILFVIIAPYLGVFVDLIARGSKMSGRQVQGMRQQEAAAREYIQNAAGSSPGVAEELAKLAGPPNATTGNWFEVGVDRADSCLSVDLPQGLA